MFDCENVTVKPYYEKEVRTEPDADEANQSRCTLFSFLPLSYFLVLLLERSCRGPNRSKHEEGRFWIVGQHHRGRVRGVRGT